MFQVPPEDGGDGRVHTAALLGFTLSSGDHSDLLKLLEGKAVGGTVVSGNLVENFDRLRIAAASHEIFGGLVEVEAPPDHPEEKHGTSHGIKEVSPSLVLRAGTRDLGIGAREVGDQGPCDLQTRISAPFSHGKEGGRDVPSCRRADQRPTK